MNRGYHYSSRVEGADAGRTLLAYLSSRFPHTAPGTWSDRIVAGLVLLDGRPTIPDTLLRRGQSVVWRRPPWEEPVAPTSFAILYRDEDVLAVAKPAGLPTLPGGGFLENTLLARVRAHDPSAAPLHRLGRWTSGAVLFARNAGAAASLAGQFANRTLEKRYRALVSGRPVADVFEIAVPIGRVPHGVLGTVHGACASGRASRTRVRIVEERAGATVCDVWIESGRPHQIRIHLAAAGHPLVGDPLYPAGGVPPADAKALPGDPGYLLHAAEVTFRHPRTGRTLAVTCAPPPEIR